MFRKNIYSELHRDEMKGRYIGALYPSSFRYINTKQNESIVFIFTFMKRCRITVIFEMNMCATDFKIFAFINNTCCTMYVCICINRCTHSYSYARCYLTVKQLSLPSLKVQLLSAFAEMKIKKTRQITCEQNNI